MRKSSARLHEFRKRRKSAHTGEAGVKPSGIFIKIGILLSLIAALFLFLRLDTKYWNGHDKVSFAYKLSNGDVGVTVADPKLSELTTLIIPGDTQVDVAENLGTMRIKNVWQLSRNEHLGGRLLPETITQNFLFPAFLWIDERGEEVGKGNIGGVLKFIFGKSETNIPLGDRLSLRFFALRVGSLGKTNVNLGQSQFLHKGILSDGLAGYNLNGNIPENLTIFFSDNDMADVGPRVYIVDTTGSPGVADKVGQILEVMGGKVVSIDKKAAESSDCGILGSNKNVVRKIATLFSCKIVTGKTDFDLEIRLGANFATRF